MATGIIDLPDGGDGSQRVTQLVKGGCEDRQLVEVMDLGRYRIGKSAYHDGKGIFIQTHHSHKSVWEKRGKRP